MGLHWLTQIPGNEKRTLNKKQVRRWRFFPVEAEN